MLQIMYNMYPDKVMAQEQIGLCEVCNGAQCKLVGFTWTVKLGLKVNLNLQQPEYSGTLTI